MGCALTQTHRCESSVCVNAREAGHLGRTATATSLWAAAPLLGHLGRGRLIIPGMVVDPCLFRLTGVHALPLDYCFLDGDGRLLLEGAAINPVLVRKGRFAHLRPLGGDDFRIEVAVAGHVDQPCGFVGGDPFGNYYHWLLDFFPRLRAFQLLIAHEPALAGARVALIGRRPAFVEDLLTAMAFPRERLLEIEAGKAYRFDTLFVLSNFTQYGHVHPLALDYLGALARPPDVAPGRRLYVSRRDAAGRRVRNEEAVTAALARLGVATVHLAGMTLAGQRALFAGAELVVGPHGAGLTNLVWTPPGCRLIELHPGGDWLHQFQLLAQALGRPYHRLAPDGAAVDPNADFVVDVDALTRAVAADLPGQEA